MFGFEGTVCCDAKGSWQLWQQQCVAACSYLSDLESREKGMLVLGFLLISFVQVGTQPMGCCLFLVNLPKSMNSLTDTPKGMAHSCSTCFLISWVSRVTVPASGNGNKVRALHASSSLRSWCSSPVLVTIGAQELKSVNGCMVVWNASWFFWVLGCGDISSQSDL